MRPLVPQDEIFVGQRMVTTISLYDPRSGDPVTPSAVTLWMRDPENTVISVGDMDQQDQLGDFEGSFVVDMPGTWRAVVEVGEPLESVFQAEFYVGTSPLV